MTGIRTMNNDDELETMIRGMGGERCTVVYFFLPWCGSCQKMNPFVDNIAEKNPNTLFLKVDAERCMSSSKKHRITKVPIFVLYNNRTRVDRVEGASPVELESKIKRIQNDIDYKKVGGLTPTAAMTSMGMPSQIGGGAGTPKMGDISDYLDRKNCRVVNDLLPTPFSGFLEGNKLVSGRGMGRLLLVYSFTEKMMIQSFKLKAPIHSGPRILRFFTTVGRGVDINEINQMNATQEVMLSEDDLAGEHVIDLRQGGFVGITGIQIFIPENMTKSRRIEIDHLIMNGAPLSLTPYAGTADAEAYSSRVVGGMSQGVEGPSARHKY